MKHSNAKSIAKKLLKDNRLARVTLDNIIYLIEGFGYEITDYSKDVNSLAVQRLIETYGLSELIARNYAFIFICGDNKYVFIDESLPSDEKLYAFAHELGHICCGHLKSGTFLHGTFSQEHEANGFAHYLLSPPLINIVYAWINCHRLATALIATIIILGMASIPITSYINSKICI